MDDLLILQQRVSEKRAQHNAAADAFYQTLQQWSFIGDAIRLKETKEGRRLPATDELVKKYNALRTKAEAEQQKRRNAQVALDDARSQVSKAATPQKLLEQIPADIPFLLLPLRLEARYITFRHVVRNIPRADVVDVSAQMAGKTTSEADFVVSEDGLLTYQIPAAHAIRPNNDLIKALKSGDLKPASGQLIKRKADREELWIRIYPDEVFKEGLEKNLLESELEAGKAFWQKLGSGTDPEALWLEHWAGISAPRSGWIVRNTQPKNYTPGGPFPASPVFPDVALKNGAYTQAPLTRLLPDHFVIRLEKKDGATKEFTGNLIPEPLTLGLDPNDDPFNTESDASFSPDGLTLKAPEQLRWMHDLKAAEEKGMAIRIDLNEHPEFKDGVDRIFVLGAKTSADATEAGRLLHDQMNNFLYKESGLAILPQGTPTNNYAGQQSGLNQREGTAKLYFQSELITPTTGGTDQNRLFQALGLPDGLRLPNGGTTDIREALLMNRLLYPATWGYYLLQFFTPELNEAKREQIRQFFINRVSARGFLPVLRLNNQPYGIIPTTSFSHWQYKNPDAEEQFLSKLWTQFLSKLNEEVWQPAAATIMAASNAGTAGKLDEPFLKMLGLNASAAQFHHQLVIGSGFQMALNSSTIPEIIRPFSHLELDSRFKSAERIKELKNARLDADYFDALAKSYLPEAQRGKIRMETIDSLPMTEDRLLELLPGKSWNYLQWLAQSDIERIWKSDHLNFDNAPAGEGATVKNGAASSLLAALSRQAILRATLEAGLRLTEQNEGLRLLKAKDFELEHLEKNTFKVNLAALSATNHLHKAYKPIVDKFNLTGNVSLEPDRWVYFTKKYNRTGTLTLSKWIDQAVANEALSNDPVLKDLQDMKIALDNLSKLPAARLERLFGEHADLCSHRLDAWMAGLLHQRLEKQRAVKSKGINLGAFGYLLGLKPSPQRAVVIVAENPAYIPFAAANIDLAAIPAAHLTAARQKGFDPDKNWDRTFFYIGTNTDSGVRLNTNTGQVEPNADKNGAQSEGFIHAPSPAHATAAAILRAGYLHHKTDTKAESLSISLNAPRVRQAQHLLEGMQHGSTLPELLGYYLERMLHEKGLDAFLYDIRKAFPLPRATDANNTTTNKLTTTDGLAVLAAHTANPNTTLLKKITPAISGTADMLDAVSDLLLAESVFQTAKGNTDRAASALRTLNSGGQIVQPEWIRSPRRNLPVNHRIGIVFNQAPAHPSGKSWSAAGSPRAALAPALNRWLAQQLPRPEHIIAVFTLPDGRLQKISMAEAGIEPIDFLAACPQVFDDAGQSPLAMLLQIAARKRSELLALEVQLEKTGQFLVLSFDFQSRVSLTTTEITVFELSALVAALHKMTLNARSLTPDDFRLPDLPGAPSSRTNPGKIKDALLKELPAKWPNNAIAKTLLEKSALLKDAIDAGKSPTDIRKAAAPVFAALYQAWQYGVNESLSGLPYLQITTDNFYLLTEKAQKIAAELTKRDAEMSALLSAIPQDISNTTLLKRLQDVAAVLFGEDIRLFPDILLENAAEIKGSYGERALLDNAGSDAVDDWLLEASLVRPALRTYRRSALLQEMFQTAGSGKLPEIIQLPFLTGKRQAWIGGPFSPETHPGNQGTLSLAFEFPVDFKPESELSGFMIDEWPEFVPLPSADTGVTFHYNQPDTEPPQAMLLAISPVEGGSWHWDYLMGAVKDALDLSKKRLVTPSDIQAVNEGVAQVLPAMVVPFMPVVDSKNINVPNPDIY